MRGAHRTLTFGCHSIMWLSIVDAGACRHGWKWTRKSYALCTKRRAIQATADRTKEAAARKFSSDAGRMSKWCQQEEVCAPCVTWSQSETFQSRWAKVCSGTGTGMWTPELIASILNASLSKMPQRNEILAPACIQGSLIHGWADMWVTGYKMSGVPWHMLYSFSRLPSIYLHVLYLCSTVEQIN